MNQVRKFGNTLRGYGSRGRVLVAVGGSALLAASAHAQTAPTSLDGFQTVATGYITAGETTAIAAATVALGWVGFKIVKKFTNGAK